MKTVKHVLILLALVIFFQACEKDFGINSSYSESYTPSGDKFEFIEENPFIETDTQNVSTFSIDADGASYSIMRKYLTEKNQKPPKDAVRTEEFINYFTFNYENPTGEHPISLNGEVAQCPWDDTHKLIRIGIKGKSIPTTEVPATNFVYLIDVSGSMSQDDKLPLLKSAFKLFVDQMRSQDRIAIVTYAGADKVALESTSGDKKSDIKKAIDKLDAGGSTAGSKGVTRAYEIALTNYIKNGNNRVILASDGDFNVGITSLDELVKLIEEKRQSGIYLTTLGVGLGNLTDAVMEKLADNGNGNYEYIDNLEQAKKVFIYEKERFVTVAKDVKVQINFNKDLVKSYRLIGYENRVLQNNDFTNDKKDAGDIGAGQTITALYEIEPRPSSLSLRDVPTFSIDFRYKKPDADISLPLALDIKDSERIFSQSSENMRFAASISGYALLLRDSKFKGSLTYNKVLQWANGAMSFDPNGYRKAFVELVKKAQSK